VGDLTPQHKEYATLIHQSGHHLIDVVKMLLDMSRLEAGKFELVTDSFDPAQIVEPCLRILEPMAAPRRVRIAVDLAPRLPPLVADERACRQILINLLSNAIKFSADGGLVSVSLRRQGRSIALGVSDQGIGMTAESVRRVGEPFFQAQDGLDRRYQGTGLGLSIVKGLVDLHQGSLHVVSTPGQGTVVTVLLPINGPAIKLEETGAVLPLHRDGVTQHMPTWQDGRRKAQ
jgi:cell cycle sensor histidine kinase DivJ